MKKSVFAFLAAVAVFLAPVACATKAEKSAEPAAKSGSDLPLSSDSEKAMKSAPTKAETKIAAPVSGAQAEVAPAAATTPDTAAKTSEPPAPAPAVVEPVKSAK